MEHQLVAALGQHVAQGAFQLLLRGGGGHELPRLHQVRQGGAGGAVEVAEIPLRPDPQGGVQHTGEHGGQGPPGDGLAGEEGARRVAARGDALAVEVQDVLIVGGVLADVGDEAPGGVGHGDQFPVDRGQDLLGQDAGQDVGHLGPAGGLVELHVTAHEVRLQRALRLEVAQVGQGPRGALPAVGQGGLGVPGPVESPDAPGENDGLSQSHRVPRAEGAAVLPVGKAVLIEGRYVVVEGGIRRQVGELPGVGPAAGKARRLGGLGGEGQQQADGQQQGGKRSFHGVPFGRWVRLKCSDPPPCGPRYRGSGTGLPWPGPPPGPGRCRGRATRREGWRS